MNLHDLITKAEAGDAESQISLAQCYENGNGVTRDDAEALKWARMAAEQGHAMGQNILGRYYFNGTGTPQDHKEAVQWFQKAAIQGLAKAQFNLASAYLEGDGVPCGDLDEAILWYLKAAKQGFAPAQKLLGNCYRRNHYTRHNPVRDVGEVLHRRPNYTEAAKWYRKAAEQGDADAQCNLGDAYADGEGVPQDFTEARKWYNLAAAKGHKTAKARLAQLADKEAWQKECKDKDVFFGAGIGSLHCKACGWTGRITASIHGIYEHRVKENIRGRVSTEKRAERLRSEARAEQNSSAGHGSSRFGYQCQSCGKFSDGSELPPESPCASCGGELSHKKPLFCPKCKNRALKYTTGIIPHFPDELHKPEAVRYSLAP